MIIYSDNFHLQIMKLKTFYIRKNSENMCGTAANSLSNAEME